MNLDTMSTHRKIILFLVLLLPLIASVAAVVILKSSWIVEIAPGEQFAPIDNRPLLVGLLIFSLGYLFFLGMLFSENLVELARKLQRSQR